MSFFSNKILLNLLACGLFVSCPFSMMAAANGSSGGTETKQQWKTFTSKESGFSVDLPSTPEHVQQSIDIPKTDLSIEYETYLSEPSENTVYVVSVWDYPSQIDMSKPEVNLQDGFGGMLSALPGSEVLNMKMSEIEGFKALEFLVKNEDIYFQGKLILVHNTLYQVFTVYKDSEEGMANNYTHFIDSFKLIEPEKKKTNGKTESPSKQKEKEVLNNKKKMNV